MADLTEQHSFTYQQLIDCGNGKIFGEGNALLPLPPMLMFDRITSITEDGGDHGKGYIEAACGFLTAISIPIR